MWPVVQTDLEGNWPDGEAREKKLALSHHHVFLFFSCSIAVFPMALVRNMRNPIFVVVVLALINLSGMVAGLATFMAKFLERQFGLTASFANMLLGLYRSLPLPGACLSLCHPAPLGRGSRPSTQFLWLCMSSQESCSDRIALRFGAKLAASECETQLKLKSKAGVGWEMQGRSDISPHSCQSPGHGRLRTVASRRMAAFRVAALPWR